MRGDFAGGGGGEREMIQSPRRKRGDYFPANPESPRALIVRVKHRVRFSEVDAMAVMWHGRYAQLFEQANEEVCRAVGLGYADFYREKLGADRAVSCRLFRPHRAGRNRDDRGETAVERRGSD